MTLASQGSLVKQASAFVCRASVKIDVTHDNEDFFHFTRGRFVQNEAHQVASRYIRFNVDELGKIAANAVGSNSCVNVEKLTDGMHNKAFLLTMDDGREVIAKIPNPNAGHPHFTTASEVATMDVMRNLLDIPVPKVYAWCTRAEENPVKAEYIIMEKATGVSLQSVWHKLELLDRFAITKEIARYQKAWTSASYEGYGSIYYALDLPEQHRLPLHRCGVVGDKRLSLGPTTGREWIDDGRQFVTVDRGPCTYQSTRSKKIQALEYYLQFFGHLEPLDSAIQKPSAWHGDLHEENIFVDPSMPTKVTCLIDWQSTEVAPLFFQTRQPFILDHEGPQATGLDRPSLPTNFTELSPEEQEAAGQLLMDQSLCVGYRRWTESQNPEIWKCFEFQETPAYELLLLARSLLVDGEAIYSARVVEHLQSNNSILKGSGLCIPENVTADIMADSEGAIRGMEAMTELQDAMGSLFPERGCVRPELYDDTKNALRQCKEQIIGIFASTEAERAAWEESWPFDD